MFEKLRAFFGKRPERVGVSPCPNSTPAVLLVVRSSPKESVSSGAVPLELFNRWVDAAAAVDASDLRIRVYSNNASVKVRVAFTG